MSKIHLKKEKQHTLHFIENDSEAANKKLIKN